MLLFFFFFVCFFFREIPENVCWQLPCFHKVKHCDSLFLCFRDRFVCKIRILNSLCEQHCKAKIISPKMTETNVEPVNGFWSFSLIQTCSFTTLSRWERVKLDPLKEVLVTSDGVAPFGLKPFLFSLRLWTLAEESRRSARWTFCHWTIQYIFSVKLLFSHFHTYKGKHELSQIDSSLLLQQFHTQQYQVLLLWFIVLLVFLLHLHTCHFFEFEFF